MVSVEVCANSVESACNAQKGGAVRVELCDNLFDGGTTPSKSQITLAKELLNIELNVIIRPRGGDFLYDDLEFKLMMDDISLCGEIGCSGVVIGVLTADGSVDINRNAILIDLAKKFGMSVTFHRAFDRVHDMKMALEDVIKLGCDRILTSGGKKTAIEGKDMIRELVELASDRIHIMAGAGVNENNVRSLIEYTGVKEVHGTFQSLVRGEMTFINPNFKDPSEYYYSVSDLSKIQDVVSISSIL